uniref:Galactose oxidase n=1 Tax=Schlesneria paludicola TaxID=360056 RepID=A0A7C2NXS2_9PLAN
MTTSIRIAAGIFLLWTSSAAAQSPPPNWVQVTDKAAFTPRDSCGEVVFNGRMWLLGGWVNSFQDPPRDVWSSADGVTWDRATEAAAWKHSDFPMAVAFQDRMWVMGGWHGGRLPHASASNAVWSSTDGANWKQETAAAAWSPRMAAGAVVFNNRLWIFGGTQKYYFGDDDDLKNDVWSSADGVHWELATDKAPWSPRAYLGAVVHAGRLWVLGGGNYLPNYQVKNDVWSSTDGVHWDLVAEAAPWSPRIWFFAAAYRERLWVLGGWSNHPSKNWNDVWTSADGKTWSEFKTETIWTPRHEHSVYVHQDKLWVVTGHAAPLSGEVWRLDGVR